MFFASHGMKDMSIETCWVIDGKSNLVRMKQELRLTAAEIATVDRGIAAIDRFLLEFGINERNSSVNNALQNVSE